MDKYERRRLRANAQYMGKSQEKFLRALRGDNTVQDKRFLYTALEKYTPKRFIAHLLYVEGEGDNYRDVNVDGTEVTLWLVREPRGGPFDWFTREEKPLLDRLWAEIEGVAIPPTTFHPFFWLGPGMRALSKHQLPYVWDTARQHILLKESLKELQHQIDLEFIREHGPSFLRTTERTALFRAELKVAARQSRGVQNCKVIKEELMAAVWHPRRVEHILDNYGWDAYNNLLGEE
jgi:hypothetical protein